MSSDAPPKSSFSSPAWVDAILIQNALRQVGDDPNIQVKGILIDRATAPGDNYGSIIYRIQVKLTDVTRECSVLVKTTPDGEAMQSAVIESGVFQREINMLAKYIPAMEGLLERVAPRRFLPLAPRCLLHGSTPAPFLVLEDLKPQGFRLAERHRGLGLRHSLMALRALARFHAASVALLNADPGIANDFPNPFNISGGSWATLVTSSFQSTANACRKLSAMEEYAEILEKFKPKAMEILTNLNNPRKDKFNVLLHGDFWTNNMMFNYHQNGQLKDFRVIDLQVSHVASPAIDLQYFLHTSISDDIYDNHIPLLVREYHTALTETLGLFGISGPSLKVLLTDLHEHYFYGLYAAISVRPIARAEAVADLNAVLAGDSSSSNFMYECASMKRWLKRVLPEFRSRGCLKL